MWLSIVWFAASTPVPTPPKLPITVSQQLTFDFIVRSAAPAGPIFNFGSQAVDSVQERTREVRVDLQNNYNSTYCKSFLLVFCSFYKRGSLG